jgi:hypothetical protein
MRPFPAPGIMTSGAAAAAAAADDDDDDDDADESLGWYTQHSSFDMGSTTPFLQPKSLKTHDSAKLESREATLTYFFEKKKMMMMMMTMQKCFIYWRKANTTFPIPFSFSLSLYSHTQTHTSNHTLEHLFNSLSLSYH